jgi:50S ribosomal subunit-associated GTPase HflX
LKSIKKGEKERQQPVAISKMQREATDELKSRLNHQLSGADKELQLAVLAELVDDFLRDYQTTQRPKVVASKQLSKVKHD